MRRRVAAGMAGIALVLVACGSALAPTPAIPAGKAALESAAAVFRSSAPRADKSSDPGRPPVLQTDPPPDAGLFEQVNAPAPGGVFTPSNEWAGWVDSDTFVQVWAGEQPEFGGRGVVMVMRRPGVGDGAHLDPDGHSTQAYARPPTIGGRLTITGVRDHRLVIRNTEGEDFEFDPGTGSFITP